MVVHTCNPNTGEAEAGGSGVHGQPGTYSETLSMLQKKKKKRWGRGWPLLTFQSKWVTKGRKTG
jgi:hypothetical protein